VVVCCLCKKNGETVNHLLLHCELVHYGTISRIVWLSVGHASSSEGSLCLLEREV
jgi:hypothetical protein